MKLLSFVQASLLLISYVCSSNEIRFDLPAQDAYSVHKKCLTMWIAKDSHVTAKISASAGTNQKVSFEIFDVSQDHNQYSAKNDVSESRVVFTPQDSSDVHFCFWNTLDQGHTSGPGYVRQISLSVQIGKTDEEYQKLAKAEKIKPQEMELIRLEQRFQSVTLNLMHFSNSDLEKLATHEQTKKRIGNFSFLSIGVLLVVGVWQIVYLRHYFKAKKLI